MSDFLCLTHTYTYNHVLICVGRKNKIQDFNAGFNIFGFNASKSIYTLKNAMLYLRDITIYIKRAQGIYLLQSVIVGAKPHTYSKAYTLQKF